MSRFVKTWHLLLVVCLAFRLTNIGGTVSYSFHGELQFVLGPFTIRHLNRVLIRIE